ncbi:MAG: hypothetical protein H0X38_04245 [Planctomycetes bacterium]|nr:hypothetical protein [Planctomycetota bacterium]
MKRTHPQTAARLLLCPLLAALLIIPVGCGQGRADNEPANLSITVDKSFVKRQSPYTIWPRGEDSLFASSSSSGHGGSGHGSGDWHFSGNDDGVIVLIAVLVAAVLIAETADVTYHNIHGLQLTMSIEGEGVYQSFPLRWGENRLQLSQFSLSRLSDGTAALFLIGSGTRHLRLRLPTAGLDWERETHAIALTGSGELIADGRAVAMPVATGDDSRRNGPRP